MSATTNFDFGVDPNDDPAFGPNATAADASASSDATEASSSSAREDLPLPDRAWRLFCQSESYSAIARELNLDRHTVARYVKQIHDETQADRRADRSLALTQALGALAQLQSTAWEELARQQGRERMIWDLYLRSAAEAAAQASSMAGGYAVRPPTYRTQTARLLFLILAALREVARLELLYADTAPARDGDAPSEEKQDRHLYIMMRRSDQEALAQIQRNASGDALADEPPAPAGPDAPAMPSEKNDPDVGKPSGTVPVDVATERTDGPSTAQTVSPAMPAIEILDAHGRPPVPHVHPKPDLRPDGTDDWYVYSSAPLSPPGTGRGVPGQPPTRRRLRPPTR